MFSKVAVRISDFCSDFGTFREFKGETLIYEWDDTVRLTYSSKEDRYKVYYGKDLQCHTDKGKHDFSTQSQACYLFKRVCGV